MFLNLDKDGEVQKERATSSKPLKEKTTKAERRALQEAQRAAKAAAKGLVFPRLDFLAFFVRFLVFYSGLWCVIFLINE